MRNATVQRSLLAAAALVLLFSAPASSTSHVLDDAAYSWWTHPIAAEDDAGRLWVGSVSSSGDVQVDIDGQRTVVDTVEDDDHNAPAIALHDDGTEPALVFNARHHKDTDLHYRTVAADGIVGPTGTLTLPNKVTYAQPLTYGDTVAVLTRSKTCRWYVVVSHDWGDTWDAPKHLLDGCDQGTHTYLTTARSSVSTFRLAAAGHPVHSDWNRIEYGLIRLTTGWITVPGNVGVANIFTGSGLPIEYGDLETVYDPPAGANLRLFDIGTVDGSPTVTFAEWDELPNDVRGPARYRTARYDSGPWTAVDVGRYTGPPFWEPSNYLPGAALGNGMLYTASQDGVERWTHGTDGTWTHDAQVASGGSLARPYVPRGGAGVLWQDIVDYPHYTDFDVDIYGSP